MLNFSIKYDPKVFEIKDNKYYIRISNKENNGLSFSNGVIKATKAPDGIDGAGGTMNQPSNAIAGTPKQGIKTIRCNSSVTRLECNDPAQQDGGKSILDIVKHILGRDDI